MVVWNEITAEVARQFLDVTWDKILVCAMTVRMTPRPQSLNSTVVTNLYPVILPDLAGVLAGSLGVASRSNIDPEFRYPSMFEPIHGSASVITPDVGRTATTQEVTDAVCRAIRASNI